MLRYRDQIRGLLEAGAAVRGIGLQYHHFRREALESYLCSENSDPVKLLEGYGNLCEFELPLNIAESTIPSAGEQGEDVQAEIVRNLYHLWFSVPGMAGIMGWNLADGTAVEGENEARGGVMTEKLEPNRLIANWSGSFTRNGRPTLMAKQIKMGFTSYGASVVDTWSGSVGETLGLCGRST